ncbi:MAG: hypothetical protein H0X33_13180 [Taibaiella sp.]|nr:hypothetical protein [Taibaiella sp.]
MAFDQGKPALTIRRNVKSVARMLLALHTATSELLRQNTALGLDFSIIQGTYPIDSDAMAAVALLGQVQTFLQTNATVITKAADIGENLP